MPVSERPKLVVTDLDGTLLRADKTVSRTTRDVLREVVAAGIPVVPVTARQPSGLLPVIEPVDLRGLAICGNGSLGIDIRTRKTWFTRPLAAGTAARIVAAVRAVEPSVLVATVGPEGEWFRAEAGYVEVAKFTDHNRTRREMDVLDVDGVTADDCSKLIFRSPEVPPAELAARVAHLVEDAEMTISGAPFVEVMGPGVTKRSGVELLCERMGIRREDVWAFGDQRNDVPMIEWAGVGFAVENAVDEVLAVADHVVGSNENDGVAQLLRALLP